MNEMRKAVQQSTFAKDLLIQNETSKHDLRSVVALESTRLITEGCEHKKA
jgi:hypothetical protein